MHRCMLLFKEMSFKVKIVAVIKILYCDTSVFIPDLRATNATNTAFACNSRALSSLYYLSEWKIGKKHE